MTVEELIIELKQQPWYAEVLVCVEIVEGDEVLTVKSGISRLIIEEDVVLVELG